MSREDLPSALAARRKLVDAALADAFHDIVPPRLREAVAWLPEAGGKRLRPAMAMLACDAAGGTAHAALPIALAVELVHNFSLVHDDIMDRDATRRGRPTVHTRWDEATAILAGDVLFARAFEVLARIPDAAAHRDAAALLSTAVLRLCEGQALDIAFETQARVTVDDYLTMIRGKTALLFEAATRGGGLMAPDRRHADALAAYGEAFGMAFQVADDILDVVGDPSELGKPWASDIRAGKRTLLVLAAREASSPARLATLERALGNARASDEDVRAAVAVLHETGAVARAEAERDAHAQRAREALEKLPPSPARDHLAALNEWARLRRS